MGLAEYFYPLVNSQEIKQQLEIFISTNEVRRLRQLESSDHSDSSFVDISTLPQNYSKLTYKQLLDTLMTNIQTNQLSQLLTTQYNCKLDKVTEAVELWAELENRLIQINKSGAVECAELSQALTDYPVWTIINFIRAVTKKSFAIRGDRKNTFAIILRCFSARDCGLASLAGNSLDGFLAVDSDSWVFRLSQSCPDMKNRIKVEKEYPFFNLTKDNELILADKHQFFDFAFNLLVSEILLRFNRDDAILTMKVEISSNLTFKEKTNLRFSKLFPKKIEDTIILPEDTGFLPAVIEDYYWSKTKYALSTKSANPVLVYRTYALLSRINKSNQIVPAFINNAVVENKDYKIFFLLKEIDEFFQSGQVGLAYFKLEDLHKFAKVSKTQLSKGAHFYLSLKELLFLLVAYGSVPPKSDEASRFYNRQDFFVVSNYFRTELEACKWIVSGSEDSVYINEGQLNFDHLDGISMNIGEKILSILQDLSPTAMTSTGSDLQEFVGELLQRSGIISAPGRK